MSYSQVDLVALCALDVLPQSTLAPSSRLPAELRLDLASYHEPVVHRLDL
jgi:hypothetical protein